MAENLEGMDYIDQFIKELDGEDGAGATSEPPKINEDEVEKVETLFENLKIAFSGQDVKVKKNVHNPCPEMGEVRLTGKKVEFPDAKLFLAANQMCDTFSILTLKSGVLEMSFQFTHLAGEA